MEVLTQIQLLIRRYYYKSNLKIPFYNRQQQVSFSFYLNILKKLNNENIEPVYSEVQQIR